MSFWKWLVDRYTTMMRYIDWWKYLYYVSGFATAGASCICIMLLLFNHIGYATLWFIVALVFAIICHWAWYRKFDYNK